MDELQRQVTALQQQVANLESVVSDLSDKITISYRQNLRLQNALQGLKRYYVATGATGPTQTPLTFKDGILSAET